MCIGGAALTDRGHAMNHYDPALQDHSVGCIYCQGVFDLFGATWCNHTGSPHLSKMCPHCAHCLCDHPMYGNTDMWKDAPAAFQRQGFRKLFVLYL